VKLRLLVATGAMFLALVVCAVPVDAQAESGWTLEPATAGGQLTGRTFFDYSLAPGQAIQDYVRLSNGTDHDITFTVYAADAYTTPEGSFALRLRDQPRNGVGGWVSLPFTQQTVAHGTTITFPFQLGVPRDAAPGDWAGGVVAVASDASTPTSGSVRIEEGVGARIYVRVQGPLHRELTITKLSSSASGGPWEPFAQSTASVTYEVTNTGNTRMTATARLDLIDAFGHTVKSFAPRALPDLLPRDITTVTESWKGLPIAGLRLHARVSLDAGEASTFRDAPAFWHVPVPVVALVLLALGGFTLLVRALMRSVLRRRPSLVPA